ncbi:MAG: hypothetical protein AAGE52_06935 [Myxococcota bacterium]
MRGVWLVLVWACGAGANASDASVDAETVGFLAVYDVIEARCAIPGCHLSPAPRAELDFATEDLAFANLVGQQARGPACGGEGVRVVAGSSAESILMSKLADVEPVCGARMPLGRRALDVEDIELIRQWIDQGARR